VVTSPPLSPVQEVYSTTELNTANEIIDQFKQTSCNVNGLILRVRQNRNNAYIRNVVKDTLVTEFEVALYEGGLRPAIVRELAKMHAQITVRDIRMVLTARGDSIVVYFLCKTVQSLYGLGQMIMSGFMHAVFAVAIESRERTTVDVYVRADEFNFRLLCLSSPQHKGLTIN